MEKTQTRRDNVDIKTVIKLIPLHAHLYIAYPNHGTLGQRATRVCIKGPLILDLMNTLVPLFFVKNH